MQDDRPLRLSSRSPFKLPARRLDELALQKQGTKLDKWTRLEKGEKELVRERKSKAAIDVGREARPVGRRRDPVNRQTRRRKFMSSHTYFHCRGVSSVSRGGVRRNLTSGRCSTLPVIPLNLCFTRTSGIILGVTADIGATCLVLLDVDTGYTKAVPAAGKTVTDNLVESGTRFVEQFFRRREFVHVVTGERWTEGTLPSVSVVVVNTEA